MKRNKTVIKLRKQYQMADSPLVPVNLFHELNNQVISRQARKA